MTNICVLSASGTYEDPWHPFAATSCEVASLLTSIDANVTVRTDVDDTLCTLDARTSLLVVNIGNAGPGTPSPPARQALLQWVQAGGSLLALHVAATTFPDWDGWENLLGGRWVRGTTFHPPKARGTVHISRDHELAASLNDFTTIDELYTSLRVNPAVNVLAIHTQDGEDQPLAWTIRHGAGRVGYLALGHDTDAFRSDGFRKLLLQLARALTQTRRN
ncbi:ThuA domain-containing protein [Curtobacterium flaccumfaciens]|uniref:ThuA domain-containing protein n=1 Tax=Curtobacterium flaccumfaciens TaxID=2035 RepID=UPI001E4C03A3|nr:ThuA domain-containing protein [Curtobacterium allii]MCE0459451.1 ThuA domain-containing protein [Curtobacterium allii]